MMRTNVRPALQMGWDAASGAAEMVAGLGQQVANTSMSDVREAMVAAGEQASGPMWLDGLGFDATPGYDLAGDALSDLFAPEGSENHRPTDKRLGDQGMRAPLEIRSAEGGKGAAEVTAAPGGLQFGAVAARAHGESTNAAEVGLRVANGEIAGRVGGRRSTPWGGFGGGATMDPAERMLAVDGEIYAGGMTETKGPAPKRGFSGGFTFDGGTQGLEGAGGRVGGSNGPLSAELTAGWTQKSRVAAHADGTFGVTGQSASGGGMAVKNGGDDSRTLSAKSFSAHTGEGVFDTPEEASAFLTAIETGKTSWTPEELATLSPGERMRVDVAQQDEAGLAGVAAVLLSGVFKEQSTQGLGLERLDDGRVRATVDRSSSNEIGGGIGAFGLLGMEHGWGWGRQTRQTADFDLSDPASAAAFEQFQRDGTLPEELPKGVTRGAGSDASTSSSRDKVTLPHGTTETLTSGREGTDTDAHGVVTPFHEGGQKSTDTWSTPWGGVSARSEEQHLARLAGRDGEQTFAMRSEYSGYGSRARFEDDLAAGTISSETKAEFGGEGGHHTIETQFHDAGVQDLVVRLGEGRAVDGPGYLFEQTDQNPLAWGPTPIERITEGDLSGLPDYIAGTGGAGADALRAHGAGDSTTITSTANSGGL